LIADALGAYLDTLIEREFDAPFLAILRAFEYYDVHFLHGSYEFGKDFIAKRKDADVVTQYAFQTKSGDIGLADWREARGQIDEMRTNNLAHPNFDASAPRRTVFVTTGRLVGAAGVAAQEYRRHLEQLGEGSFEVWDRETITEFVGDRPELGLTSTINEPLLHLVGEIATGDVTFPALEEFSRSWVGENSLPPWHAALAGAVIANRCRTADRLDLAALTALLIVRTVAWHMHERHEEHLDDLLGRAGDLFAAYAQSLADLCTGHANNPDLFLGAQDEFATWATYPVRCIRTAEILALHALRLRHTDLNAAHTVEDIVITIAASQPGAAHPISDTWAASVIPISLVLGTRAADVFSDWITETTRWVANYYDAGEGLASLDAPPSEELAYLTSGPLEHITLQPRSTSLIASAVLDAVSVLQRSDLYELALNEYLAVGASPYVIEVPDNTDQYTRDGSTITCEVNPAYDQQWDPNGPTAAHHRRCPDAYQLVSRGRVWEHLALTAVLRDRWFTSTMRKFR